MSRRHFICALATGHWHFTLILSTFGVLPGKVVLISAVGLPLVGGTNLVSHPTSWRAWLSWLSWVTSTATEGRLEVMDGLLKDLPFSALPSIEL